MGFFACVCLLFFFFGVRVCFLDKEGCCDSDEHITWANCILWNLHVYIFSLGMNGRATVLSSVLRGKYMYSLKLLHILQML